MSIQTPSEDEIFHVAREISDPDTRSAYLHQACGSKTELFERIVELLRVTEDTSSFLENPPAGIAPTVDLTRDYQPLVGPGQVIGPYKIREQIGDGGMGVVFVAEQEKPLRRKVALKVIKPGMDSKAVLARFDAERNALALMNHPNIAKVLDAGTTEQGHPYFVMELIQGKVITEYCDQKKLTIKERLELFTRICNAVQHAHQKGVIHRDIKPSNILVTEIDGKPLPKVIDFGVAKALGANLTDRTVYTSYQALVGTPLYMSPEQTQLSGVDVDTSSDVYSLGILLYELLTGTTPLSPEELKQAAQDEVLRRIRETEPPRPSNRISSLGETSSQVSECRGAQPEQLGRLVRGDLDWIVMKALEKDRNRRYKTADAFATDIGRHLANEPVEARPPALWYQLSKSYQRNRGLINSVSAVVVALLVGIAALLWSLREVNLNNATLLAQKARLEKANSLANKLLSDLRDELQMRATQHAMSGRRKEALEALSGLVQHGDQDAWQPFVLGHLDFYEGRIEAAHSKFREACRLDDQFVAARMMYAISHLYCGHASGYRTELAKAGTLVPKGTVDRLYAIQANMYGRGRTQESINELQEFFRDQPYIPVARIIRAEVLTHKGYYEQDAEAIENAAHDAKVALEEMPGSPMAAFIEMFAHTSAVRLYKNTHSEENLEKHIIAGMENARQLAGIPWAAAHVYRAMFYGEVESNSTLERQAWSKARDVGLSGFLLEHYLTSQLKRGEECDIDRRFDISVEPFAALAKAMLQAHDPERRRDWIEQIRDGLVDEDASVDFYVVAVLFLLGDDVENYANQAFGFEHFRATRPTNTGIRLAEFFRGEVSEDLLIENCRSDGVDDLAFVQLCVGMKLIGEQKQEKALKPLSEAASSFRDRWSAFVAEALLARLNADQAWPFGGRG